MSSVIHTYGSTDTPYLPSEALEQPCWYAIHTRAQHEKRVEARLRECGISTFLPLVRQVHRWSDRRKVVDVPLFPGYAFVRIIPTYEAISTVVRDSGVVRLLAMGGVPAPIPDEDIDSVRALLTSNLPCVNYPFLKVGQRVRIRGGSLDGVEGIFIAQQGSKTLVVSVDLIERSLAVRIQDYDVEVLS